MAKKRIRVFAGPNGSGKTTIFKSILIDSKVNLGVYVNADEIEYLLTTNKGTIDFHKEFELDVDELELISFFRNSQFSPIKRSEADLYSKLKIESGVLTVDTSIDSYLSADLAEFLRRKLLSSGVSFTYETVMSHPSKVDFLKHAKEAGYRVYLYYISTNDPAINVSRVEFRVTKNGHSVSPDIIKSRYERSLNLLQSAVLCSDRAYIFDNTGTKAELVAEITDGSEVRLNFPEKVPFWVEKYLLGS